jgi:hypothetical protein
MYKCGVSGEEKPVVFKDFFTFVIVVVVIVVVAVQLSLFV